MDTTELDGMRTTRDELRATCHWIQNNFPTGLENWLSGYRPNEFKRRLDQAISMIEFEFGVGTHFAALLANIRDRRVSPGSSALTSQWQQAVEVIADAMMEIDRREIVRRTENVTNKSTGSLDSSYVNPLRIQELKDLTCSKFDTSRLIRLLEELNAAAAQRYWLSVMALLRTILHHVPPVFGRTSFAQVRSQYNGKSFGKTMDKFEDSLKNLADEHLHQQMLEHDPLPVEQQADFRQPLDRLLVEVLRLLKREH